MSLVGVASRARGVVSRDDSCPGRVRKTESSGWSSMWDAQSATCWAKREKQAILHTICGYHLTPIVCVSKSVELDHCLLGTGLTAGLPSLSENVR